jgi:hypothetical protein
VFDACLDGQAGVTFGAALSDRVRRFVSAQRDAIQALSPQRRLVHCDFDGTNVLVERRGDGFVVSGVIDWEFALSGPPIVDLSSMLRYPENLPPGFDTACIESFVGSGGELAERWPMLVRVIDLLAFCLFLNKPDAIDRRRIYDTALRATDEKLRAIGF